MHSRNFDFEQNNKSHHFLKKFAGFFDLESVCESYTEPCLWNNLTYKTLDGEITPAYYGTPNIGQFITKSGALYMLYTYGENDLWAFVDINGIRKRPNRFGIDVFLFYIPANTGILRYMGASGTPYQSISLYCNPYVSNKFNGFSCPYKAVLDRNYFEEAIALMYSKREKD